MSRRLHLKNFQREHYNFQFRVFIAMGFVFVLSGILIARFVYLQIFQHDHYLTQAENNRISFVPTPPNRGLILDRNGKVLAHNYSAYTLEITRSKINDLEETIDQLSTLVEITNKDRKRFKKFLEESKDFESIPIRTRLNHDELARFAAQSYRFQGVEIKARLFRQYPFGEVGSHILGYIGRINDKDLEELEEEDNLANYRGTSHIGKTGLEQSYESVLHGTTGFEEVEIDAGGRALRTLKETSPISGDNLLLSIDIELQKVAEELFGNYRGALVAIDPNNGEVLAFVSRPGFDPNLFVDGIDPQNWDALNNSLDRPLHNRALRAQYPPGSTFKPFMALAALDSGKRTAAWSMPDPGFFMLPGVAHRWRDDKAGGHGWVDMHRSIAASCDTYYYRLAYDMGIDAISSFMPKFGFGQKTGIDLEGEAVGILPSQEWKAKRFAGSRYRAEHRKWYTGDVISVGIGQGYNAYTPLQLAFATATLANHGVGYKPHLVREVQSSKTGQKNAIKREAILNNRFNPDHLATIRRAMVAVTEPGGTAAAIGGASYAIAGKTGTAQVIRIKQNEKYDASRIRESHRDHAWFMGYAPAETPKIAIAVIVENGGFGASTAAPIVRRLMDYYLLGRKSHALKVEEVEAIERNSESDHATHD